MIDLISIRKNTILLLFSISIFFSFVNIFYIELRFIYLFSILFIFFEKNVFKKLIKNSLRLFLFFFLFLFIHLYLNNIINFNNQSISIFFQLKVFFQILFISFSVSLIYYFKEILFLNLKKLFDIFIFIFLVSIFSYNVIYTGILSDTLYKCDVGFFYYTKFIFYENSHFGIIAATVILNFIYNIKRYLKNKFFFVLNVIFILFAFGNFSLSFYATSSFSLILIFFCYKTLDKFRIILLILFLLLSNFFMFYSSHVYKFLSNDKENLCISKIVQLDQKYKLNSNIDLYQGKVTKPKDKLKHYLRNETINLTTAIHIYSLYVAKKALLNNPFGYGLHNYKKFREKIDKSMKIREGYDYRNYKAGKRNNEIIFDETYMPKLYESVLNFNINSGSNNFSKIIVEFGIFGILFLLFLIIILISNKIDNEFKFLLLPLVFAQLYIRGAGYFNSGFLIISIILTILMFQNIFKKNEK